MCGLTGHFSFKENFDTKRFADANELISYRGPDDNGYISISNTLSVAEHAELEFRKLRSMRHNLGALGFRRLSVLDLTAQGHQPMSDSSRNFWIVFNGEVYNYLELKIELTKLGYDFKSNTDTEVVLTAYIEWGPKCLSKFNGMWAFAILDIERKCLFCSRDRFGIKPFNYYFDENCFSFASEIKQLLTIHPQLASNIDQGSLFDFLIFGLKNHSENTFYYDIKELRPGHYIECQFLPNERMEIKITKWWDLSYNPTFNISEKTAADEVLELLKSSIKIRLRSDVPVGTALSGGLDSSGIAALISQDSSKIQKVFTVTSKDERFDESKFADEIISKYDLQSYMVEFGCQPIDELEKIIWHHDQPVQSSAAFGGWILQKLISESDVIVNLNGQGADELMSGYSRPPYLTSFLGAFSESSRIEAVKELFSNVSREYRKPKFLVSSTSSDLAKLLFKNYAYKNVARKRSIFFDRPFCMTGMQASHFLNQPATNLSNPQKAESYDMIKFTNLPRLLHHVDRDSSAHSLEARTPFLDYRLVELLFNLPTNLLLKDGFTKYIYRQAIKEFLPEKLLWDRRKSGFRTPANDYVSNNLDYIGTNFSNANGRLKFMAPEISGRTSRAGISNIFNENSTIAWRTLTVSMWLNNTT